MSLTVPESALVNTLTHADAPASIPVRISAQPLSHKSLIFMALREYSKEKATIFVE